MKCHQILTGAVNSGDNTYSTGSIEGVHFTAYCSGCNIVILSSNFQPVQIIPGTLTGNVQVNCINAATDVGKIAACYGGPLKSNQLNPVTTSNNLIAIFEPVPIIDQISEHKLDYEWIRTAEIEPNCSVSVLSWNVEGNKLLIGGMQIQLWQMFSESNEFNAKSSNEDGLKMKPFSSKQSEWNCVWSCPTSTPIFHLSFSPDGTLFCSTGRADRLVKIWYETSAQNYPSSLFDNGSTESLTVGHGKSYRSNLSYSFIYIPHPRAVIGISWRKVSKYMPKCSVANMLVTSCRDNICRLWVQTFLPEDDLVNVSQLDGVSDLVTPRAQTQRHRQKILNFFRHKRSTFKRHKDDSEHDSVLQQQNELNAHQPIPNLPSTFSCHDFHGFGVHGTAITPGGLHFHLTASINAENDIPLVPSLTHHPSESDIHPSNNIGPKVTVSNNDSVHGTGSPADAPSASVHSHTHHHHEESDKPLFVINWLNNKEMAYTQNAERILHEIVANIISGERQQQQQADQEESSEGSNVQSENTVESVVKRARTEQPGSAQPVVASSSRNSSSNISIITAVGQDQAGHESPDHRNRRTVADYLDRKLEALMRDWNHSSDLLYSIHPLDGSLLVWLVEWLDETRPSMFRQPQISFSSRIPNSIPLGDASTMSHNISLYLPECCMDLKTILCTSSSSIISAALNTEQHNRINLAHKTQQQHNQHQQPLFGPSSFATPTLCMVTKQQNGSLNLWKLSFSEKGHFTQLLSIGHLKRVSGHRFRVNDIACHPILPLLLSTSHHNVPGTFRNRAYSFSPNDQTVTTPDSTAYLVSPTSPSQQMVVESRTLPNTGFCSELILWKVDSVGPLMKSGGISELARINSLEPTAFANVAWIPTLLPSTALGPISNSPSACFVASDGRQLRIYQAVIDARSLLAEAQRYMLNVNDQRRFYYDSSDDEDEVPKTKDRKNTEKVDHEAFRSIFKIVSLQSTSRPGCVLELSPIVDARHDWQNTQLLHLFQEQLIIGNKRENPPKNESDVSELKIPEDILIDLTHSNFEETFYLVVIEKTGVNSELHMWRITMSSHVKIDASVAAAAIHEANGDDDSSRSATPDTKDNFDIYSSTLTPPLSIKTRKICHQVLSLPPDVEVIHATPSAGHLSSSNIYPACYAPFLVATACSDNRVRFWHCQVSKDEFTENLKFEWLEWKMTLQKQLEPISSSVELPGSPLYISCAYSGRIACAFKDGHSFVDLSDEDSAKKECRFINVGISIYECQSSGGSEWILEDTIRVNRIPLIDQSLLSSSINESNIASIVDNALRTRKLSPNPQSTNPFLNDSNQPEPSKLSFQKPKIHSVASYSTIQSLKQTIAEQGNQFSFCQKSPILLDWVSTEDGSHILTCSAGHKVTLFAPISHSVIPSTVSVDGQRPGMGSPQISTLAPQSLTSGGQISLSSSNFRMNTLDLSSSSIPITRWMILRVAELSSIDSLPPLPMQLSWVRDGILVIGMDNEMLIFTQWKIQLPSSLPIIYERNLTSRSSNISMVVKYPYDSVEFPSDRLFTPSNKTSNDQDSKNDPTPGTTDKFISDEFEDFGAFESFRNSSPVIPQYHPKQLMELLAFGKIHRVRAILSHLVSSLCSINSVKEYLHHPASMQQQHTSFESSDRSPRQWTRTRALSVAAQHSPRDPNYLNENAGEPIVAEEIQLDYTEIASIRPLPLYALIQADNGVIKEKSNVSETDGPAKKDSGLSWNLETTDPLDADNFFDYGYKTQVEETLDEFLGNRTAFNFSNVATSKFLKQQSQNQDPDTDLYISINFDQKQAQLLTKLLTHSHLPGLTSLDQMHLLALADSLASFSLIDQTKGCSESTASLNNDSVMDEQQITITADSLDDCGLRYLLNMRQHLYLLKCLPLKQRNTLQRNGLGTHNIIWAFHSETQEELVQLILASSNKITWSDLRELGVGFWIRNNSLLKKVIDRLAKAAFKAKNDPLDASIYYLAMKKKNLVWGLYRSCQDKKMTDFFANNFNEDKWRKAALKNAYVLMGKQRFEHSVSFFLLAGSLWDAVEICINRLNDLQLAMVIIRLYEGGDIDAVPDTLKRLINEEVLGYRNGVQDLQYAHPDPFLRSMTYWMLGECNSALSTLLEVNVGRKHYRMMNQIVGNTTVMPTNSSEIKHEENAFEGLHSNVFNFYLYLRTQPLIVRRAQVARQNIGSSLQKDMPIRSKKSFMFTSSSSNKFDAVAVTPFERRLFFLTAYRHLQAGCPSLALEVLSRLPTNVMSDTEKNEIEECSRRLSVPDAVTAVGHINGDAKSKTAKSTAQDLFGDSSSGLDWGAPATDLFAPVSTDDLELKIDLGDENEEDDEFKKEEPKMKENKEEEIFEKKDSLSSKVDVMTQQFKFISCLKILMEELSTLATGFEVDGGQLRYQLYVWLERSVKVLKEICKYHTFSMRSDADRSSIDSGHGHSLVPVSTSSNKQSGILVNVVRNRKSSDNSPGAVAPSLHEILLADKEDFQAKLERCHRRKAWLSANEALLRNLLSYCSLHGAHGGGLASVRMELILLLQELQQDRSPQQQLLSPLPLPTTLPLLTASVASQKTVVADPIRHLQSMAHDILQTLTEINTYVHIPTCTNLSSLPDFLALPPFMVSGTATTFIPAQETQFSQQNYISTLYTLIHILRDLGISLSSCIYQSLCDCDSVSQTTSVTASGGLNQFINKKSFLSRYKDKNVSLSKEPGTKSDSEETKPLKWPGVQSLQAMIVREKDEDLPKLHTLLCEGFVAVYLSQLVYALTICDSSILYRLVGLKFTEKTWGDLFGCGTRKLLYVSTSSVPLGQSPGSLSPKEAANGTDSACSPHRDLFGTLVKQRMRLHMRILEQLNQAAEVVGNVATSPSNTLQNITSPFMQQSGPSAQAQGLAPTVEQRPTYREVFVPPKISIINQLMIKPELPDDLIHLDYDSFGSNEELNLDDDDETSLRKKFEYEITDDEYNEWDKGSKADGRSETEKLLEKKKANLEYELYAWCIIRLAITKICYEQINNFLQVSGMEKVDLPTTSPLIHAILRTISRWQYSLQFYMNQFSNLPDNFLDDMFVDNTKTGISKYKTLLKTNNTPFRHGYASIKSSKRLWNYLVRQPSVQEIFIRYIFGKNRSLKLLQEYGASAICIANPDVAINEQYDHDTKTGTQPSNEDVDTGKAESVISYGAGYRKRPPESTRIVHKDQDNISAFCVNRSNTGLMACSTPKEIQELNIKQLLEVCVPWMEEDTEMDILNFRQRSFETSLASSYVDFLLVQHPTDRLQTSPGGLAFQKQSSTTQSTPSKQATLVKRHKTETVRRLSSHPTYPLYLSGGQDGCVQLWEWCHIDPLSTPRPAGTYAKVTHVGFSQQGSKFGVTDSDGALSLWQVTNTTKSFWNTQCHNKTTSDFTFLNSSTLLMAAGHSTDHRNVVLLDTLVPPDRSIVSSFACHEHHGASSISYAPLSQLIITGGKKGDVFVFDIRQRVQKDQFHAHDSAVKCISIEPSEEFFATGSADGDIKVWSLYGPSHNLLYSFPGEHARNTFFRNIGMGVSHLYIDDCGRLFSCGADGSLKMRHLPTLECQPTHFFMPNSASNISLVLGSGHSDPIATENLNSVLDDQNNGTTIV